MESKGPWTWFVSQRFIRHMEGEGSGNKTTEREGEG